MRHLNLNIWLLESIGRKENMKDSHTLFYASTEVTSMYCPLFRPSHMVHFICKGGWEIQYSWVLRKKYVKYVLGTYSIIFCKGIDGFSLLLCSTLKNMWNLLHHKTNCTWLMPYQINNWFHAVLAVILLPSQLQKRFVLSRYWGYVFPMCMHTLSPDAVFGVGLSKMVSEPLV